jgi:hypothetical protein
MEPPPELLYASAGAQESAETAHQSAWPPPRLLGISALEAELKIVIQFLFLTSQPERA